MDAIREPAVAGTFYPAEPALLRDAVRRYLQPCGDGSAPKALIAPHAGYVYSGAIAGRAYSSLAPVASSIKRVALLGPSHRVGFRGMAVPTATSYRTPLGDIPIDSDAIKRILDLPNVGFLDQAHQDEHSLEVHLPFLQEVLRGFELVPVVVGDAAKEDVARVIETLWGGDETLVVVSSDLSHYHAYDDAARMDRNTADRIVNLEANLVGEEACGCRPINGLLHFARLRNFSVREIEVKNSGDTAGPRDQVVGYGAFKLVASEPGNDIELSPTQKRQLIQLARESIHNSLEGEAQRDIDLDGLDPALRAQAATFVTINLDGQLRGCIGSLEAHRPLALDVAHNARAAAFEDPRFPPLTAWEHNRIDLHVSVLSAPRPMRVASRGDLIAQLRPGVDGLIIREGKKQATYLPSVWSQLPEPERFVAELRRKAGLEPDGWREDTQALRYTTFEFTTLEFG